MGSSNLAVAAGIGQFSPGLLRPGIGQYDAHHDGLHIGCWITELCSSTDTPSLSFSAAERNRQATFTEKCAASLQGVLCTTRRHMMTSLLTVATTTPATSCRGSVAAPTSVGSSLQFWPFWRRDRSDVGRRVASTRVSTRWERSLDGARTERRCLSAWRVEGAH